MDLNFREVLVVAPLAVALVVFGVYPAKILAMTEPSVRRILSLYDQKQTSAGVHACVQCLSLGDNQTCAGRE